MFQPQIFWLVNITIQRLCRKCWLTIMINAFSTWAILCGPLRPLAKSIYATGRFHSNVTAFFFFSDVGTLICFKPLLSAYMFWYECKTYSNYMCVKTYEALSPFQQESVNRIFPSYWLDDMITISINPMCALNTWTYTCVSDIFCLWDKVKLSVLPSWVSCCALCIQ